MNREVKHTPTPWKLQFNDNHTIVHEIDDKHYRFIALCDSTYDTKRSDGVEQDNINAAFIVRAVNSHDALLKALKISQRQLAEHGTRLNIVDDAIALAEGKE